MKILVVDAWLPTPDRDSASLRMFNLLRLLREFGPVTFAADDYGARHSGLEAVLNLGLRVLTPPGSVQEHLTELGDTYDVIFLSRVHVARKYLAIARLRAPKARIVFDTTDLVYLRRYRRGMVSGNADLLQRALEIKALELALMRAADMTLVVSAAEQEILARECPEARVRILSNVHDVYHLTRAFGERGGIVFIGAFEHHPNADAMEWFCEDVLPLMRKTLASTRITVVGSLPPEWLQAVRGENFVVAHQLHDLVPLLSECRITMAPLRYGAGVKGKVLLSMGYGVPVVGTTIAAEGIPAMHRRDMLIADDAISFSDALCELYGDERLWTTLADHGKEVVARRFSREVARNALANLFADLRLV